MSQPESVGNTNTTDSQKQASKNKAPKNQLYCWTFTLFPDEDGEPRIEVLHTLLKTISKKFIVQMEMTPTTQKLHYQGVVSLKQKEYFNTMRNLLGHSTHIEPCINWWKSVIYCSKTESRAAGPWNESSILLKVVEPIKTWQLELIQMLKQPPDNRTIIWRWETTGGVGKTQFCKWLCINMGAQMFPGGRSGDIAYALKTETRIVIFDYPREKQDFVNYNIIEQIKNGAVFSSKYESNMLLFNPPHLLCFANFEPHYEALSHDRWNVKYLNY